MLQTLYEMKRASCRVWTLVAVSISYDDNPYTPIVYKYIAMCCHKYFHKSRVDYSLVRGPLIRGTQLGKVDLIGLRIAMLRAEALQRTVWHPCRAVNATWQSWGRKAHDFGWATFRWASCIIVTFVTLVYHWTLLSSLSYNQAYIPWPRFGSKSS